MSKPIDKAIECDNKRPKDDLKMLVHSAIGLSFMLLFPLLPPFEPITPVGMHILGIFIGMVYLWSALNSIWPSIFGIVLRDSPASPALKAMPASSWPHWMPSVQRRS